MSDRNDHYVPERRNFGKGPDIVPITASDAHETVLVEEVVAGIGRVQVERRVAYGLPDELNREPGGWRWADYSDSTEDGEAHWSRFDGHRILVDVQLRQWNYREVNDWKGRDEIRPASHAVVSFNGQPVWERSGGNSRTVLRKLADDIGQLLDISPLLAHVAGDERPRFALIGRKVWYREHPGVITRFIGEQGCLIIDADPGPWPDPPWADDTYYDADESVKVEILSPHIWWWREIEGES